jgi:PAS domain S-box-containing protein
MPQRTFSRRTWGVLRFEVFCRALEPAGAPPERSMTSTEPDHTQQVESSALEQRLHVLQVELDELRRSESELTESLAAQTERGAASQQQFRLLVESVREYAIFMLDERGHVATWNVGARRIKGYTAEQIIGKHFSTFYPPDVVATGKCEYELEVAAQDGRFEEEGWRVRKDGTQFWANVVISPIRDAQGTLVGFAKVTRDLTERKRAQEEQAARQEEQAARRIAEAARQVAEEANRAKDEFLAMLGHELRNPLAPIATALQLMQMRGDGHTSREQQVIERQVRHMMRLVDDLLDVARITRGALDLKLEVLDLRDVLAKALELASPLLEQRRHHVRIEAPEQPVLVEADEARLTQVFGNILTNAARYTDAGGHISVEVGRDNGEVDVAVRDDGHGIAAELLPKIFDLFVQGHQDADRSVGGLGIGLTLARRLVEKQGGKIWGESAGVGKGSTFRVRLPAFDSVGHGQALPPPALQASVERVRRILVVDDNRDAAEMLAEVLQAVGHDVRVAGDAAEALQLLSGRFRPEVAVLDIGLPVMDGYGLAARLQSELGAAAPRLIALSGYGQQRDRERSAQAGFAAHFVKPVDIQQLLELISKE